MWGADWKFCYFRYPEWQNFQFIPNNYCSFFFLHTLLLTIVFQLEYALFYQFYTEITTFSTKKCWVPHLSTTPWRHAQDHLTPPHVRRKHPEWLKIAENLVRYARKVLFYLLNLSGMQEKFYFTYWTCQVCKKSSILPTEMILRIQTYRSGQTV